MSISIGVIHLLRLRSEGNELYPDESFYSVAVIGRNRSSIFFISMIKVKKN